MFSKDKKSGKMASQHSQAEHNTLNQIAAGTTITGEIVTNSVIRFDGKLKGNLTTEAKLVVGKTGEIIGEIKCKNADVEGKIEGKIDVSELLSLKSTSRFNGDITTNKLHIEPGAVFSGTCKMDGQATSTTVNMPKNGKKQQVRQQP